MAFDNSPEAQALRKKAKEMGVKFHPATGIPRLKKLMAEFADQQMGQVAPETETEPEEKKKTARKPVEKTPRSAKIITPKELLEYKKKEQLRLVRVIIHCNNEDKQEWQGEIFKVGNRLVGSVTRWVPFDNENGWHVEQIILDTLKNKRCQKWRNVKLPSGETRKQAISVPEFTITELPPLTPEELRELADDQRARGAVDA